MTPSELKYNILSVNPDSHFFDRKTMKFFGDSMANYGCRKTVIVDYEGNKREVFELYRKKPVKHGLKSSAYFDAVTFEQVRIPSL